MVFKFRSQDLDIQSFLVKWDDYTYDDPDSQTMHVNRWILDAVKYNVQQISIEISQCHNFAYEFPHDLLNCKSLRRLIMYAYGYDSYTDIILPESMNLPHLQELFLYGLSISDVELSKRLFSSCPVLEILSLVDCKMNLIVDSPSLKQFACTSWCTNRLPQNDTMAHILKLCAPNLNYLVCASFLTQDYTLQICSPLSWVRFLINLKEEEDENADTFSQLPSIEKVIYGKRMMKFLEEVYMVKGLILSAGFLEVLSQSPDLLCCQPPRLHNLQCLVLEMWSTRGCIRAIRYLLKISPNIRAIFLKSEESKLADFGDDWDAGLSSPAMLSHLKYVQIEEAEGCDAEFKLLSSLLNNAKVLVAIVVFFRSSVRSSDRVSHVLQFEDRLRAVPTASSSVQLLFY